MHPRKQDGLTFLETCIALAVLILAALILHSAMLPYLTRGHVHHQALTRMKSLHLATQQMALDATTTGATNIGWPGDIDGTFTNWAVRLVQGGYATTNEFCEWMSGPGAKADSAQFPNLKTKATLVYAVRETSDGSTVFLSSVNFTNTPTGGLPLSATAPPYGNTLFIVFRKAGDGAILPSGQVGNTNLIGAFAPLCQ